MTPTQPLISIIVPIYNSELYLSECLNSLAAQTYTNIEVVLINDGSTDKSEQIAKNICNIDNRFKLLSQSNSGVASARQLGFDNASGEYIIHCDSDDIMTKTAIEHLYNSITKNSSDMSVGAYIKESESGNIIEKHYAIDSSDFTKKLLSGEYRGVLWNKLIKTKLCKEVEFSKNLNYMEDILYLAKILSKKNIKISFTNEIVYFYRKVESSYTNSLSEKSIEDSIKVTKELCSLFSNHFDDEFINHVKNRLRVIVLLNSNQSVTNIFPESNRYILKDKKMALKHKILLGLDFVKLNRVINSYRYIASKKK